MYEPLLKDCNPVYIPSCTFKKGRRCNGTREKQIERVPQGNGNSAREEVTQQQRKVIAVLAVVAAASVGLVGLGVGGKVLGGAAAAAAEEAAHEERC